MVAAPVKERIIHYILMTLLIGFFAILIVCRCLHQPKFFHKLIPLP